MFTVECEKCGMDQVVEGSMAEAIEYAENHAHPHSVTILDEDGQAVA